MCTRQAISKLNIRGLQAYGALCLLEWCKHLNVRHAGIDRLIAHLFAVLAAHDLPEWEREGALLAINGRGDDLPDEVVNLIPANAREQFLTCVESCVEIGMADMYGAATEEPLRCLEECLSILSELRIGAPSLEGLPSLRVGETARDSEAWGVSISSDEFERVAKANGVQKPRRAMI